jgi:hypothetical protein
MSTTRERITAKIITDSTSKYSPRLTSIQVSFPRIILAEVNTHRVFSRNYRSSRAVPVAKMIEEVRTNPYEPMVWLKNKPGMQASEPMSLEEIGFARTEWLRGAKQAADIAERLMKIGLHKQWANRPLEPYLYVHGLITSVEWENFFSLRKHTDAQPEFERLAEVIKEALAESTPTTLEPGQWHLPYVRDSERSMFDLSQLIKLSVARVARVSYFTFEGKEPNPEADLVLYDKLVGSKPIHASPAEAQATPDIASVYKNEWLSPYLHGNLKGWRQYRKTLERGVMQ